VADQGEGSQAHHTIASRAAAPESASRAFLLDTRLLRHLWYAIVFPQLFAGENTSASFGSTPDSRSRVAAHKNAQEQEQDGEQSVDLTGVNGGACRRILTS
jgi:hypothetical protein